MLDKLLKLYHKEDVSMPSLLATTKCSELGDMTLDEALQLCVQALKTTGDEDYIGVDRRQIFLEEERKYDKEDVRAVAESMEIPLTDEEVERIVDDYQKWESMDVAKRNTITESIYQIKGEK